MEGERKKLMLDFKTYPEGMEKDEIELMEESEDPPLFIDYV